MMQTIDRISHADGVDHFNWVVMHKKPGGQEAFDKGERVATKEEIPDGEMLGLEVVHSSVHMGSHVRCAVSLWKHVRRKAGKKD